MAFARLDNRLLNLLKIGGRSDVRAGFHDRLEGLMSEIKESIQPLLEKPASKSPPQPAERRFVVDFVPDDRSTRAIIEEEMAVIPGLKRPGHLSVREHPSWFVFRVLGNPLQRDEAHMRSQTHPAAGTNGMISFNDFDFLPGWRESLKRSRGLVEREDDRRRNRDP